MQDKIQEIGLIIKAGTKLEIKHLTNYCVKERNTKLGMIISRKCEGWEITKDDKSMKRWIGIVSLTKLLRIIDNKNAIKIYHKNRNRRKRKEEYSQDLGMIN